jgi:hypothetical protein
MALDATTTSDHISASTIYVMGPEEHLWNVIVLQRVRIFNLVYIRGEAYPVPKRHVIKASRGRADYTHCISRRWVQVSVFLHSITHLLEGFRACLDLMSKRSIYAGNRTSLAEHIASH